MKTEPNNITAIILAGGKSSRMGIDKGHVKIGDMSMIQHTINNAKRVTDQIIIIANNKNYNNLGVSVFSDVYTGKGPLGGIHAGLAHSKTAWNWVVGCDMPNIGTGIISYLLNHVGNNQAVVPIWKEKQEPLCAIYHKACTNEIEACLKKEQLKMSLALSTLKVNFINITKDLEFYSPFLFTNLNSQQDVELFNIKNNES